MSDEIPEAMAMRGAVVADDRQRAERLNEVAAMLRTVAGLLAYRRDLAELMNDAAEKVALVAEELDA